MTYTAGHGRDSDLELLVLYNHWIETLDRSLVCYVVHCYVGQRMY